VEECKPLAIGQLWEVVRAGAAADGIAETEASLAALRAKFGIMVERSMHADSGFIEGLF
jgi:hypothetical protein